MNTLYKIYSIFILSLLFVNAQNQIHPTSEQAQTYKTPLAGKEFTGDIFGKKIEFLEKDRRKTMAVSVGSSMYTPDFSDFDSVPYAAFYYANSWNNDKRRIKAIAGGVANLIEFYEGSWNNVGWEFALRLENYTIPIPSKLIIDGEDVQGSDLYWGFIRGSVGLGWRTNMSPGEVDNYFSIYLLYEPGYMYFGEADDTADNFVQPRSTFEDRIHLQVRLDKMQRNLMELNHLGWFGGIDFIYGHRYNWDDHDFNGAFTKEDTEFYDFFSLYFNITKGMPFLSERHRFSVGFYAGMSIGDNVDRYSAPRLGGGPGSAESIYRSPIPGAQFNEFLASRYALVNVEYRYEVFFFLFLHARITFGGIREAQQVANGDIALNNNEFARAVGLGVTSGFLWNSQLHIEYVNDEGVLGREDQGGHNIFFSWTKAF